jgi:hypothetical protein
MWPHVIGAYKNCWHRGSMLTETKIFAPVKRVPFPLSLGLAVLTLLDVDREGYQEPLQFPPFHQEILHASSWDAGQLLGRVRIVITEGFSRENATPTTELKRSFIRIRDVLAFSFQHAPMRMSLDHPLLIHS